MPKPKIFHRERRDRDKHQRVMALLTNPQASPWALCKACGVNGRIVQGETPGQWPFEPCWPGGEHELAIARERLHAVLQNPNLDFSAWAYWMFLDVEAALANPSYPLFLIEKPSFFATQEGWAAKRLLKALEGKPAFADIAAQCAEAMRAHASFHFFL